MLVGALCNSTNAETEWPDNNDTALVMFLDCRRRTTGERARSTRRHHNCSVHCFHSHAEHTLDEMDKEFRRTCRDMHETGRETNTNRTGGTNKTMSERVECPRETDLSLSYKFGRWQISNAGTWRTLSIREEYERKVHINTKYVVSFSLYIGLFHREFCHINKVPTIEFMSRVAVRG